MLNQHHLLDNCSLLCVLIFLILSVSCTSLINSQSLSSQIPTLTPLTYNATSTVVGAQSRSTIEAVPSASRIFTSGFIPELEALLKEDPGAVRAGLKYHLEDPGAVSNDLKHSRHHYVRAWTLPAANFDILNPIFDPYDKSIIHRSIQAICNNDPDKLGLQDKFFLVTDYDSKITGSNIRRYDIPLPWHTLLFAEVPIGSNVDVCTTALRTIKDKCIEKSFREGTVEIGTKQFRLGFSRPSLDEDIQVLPMANAYILAKQTGTPGLFKDHFAVINHGLKDGMGAELAKCLKGDGQEHRMETAIGNPMNGTGVYSLYTLKNRRTKQSGHILKCLATAVGYDKNMDVEYEVAPGDVDFDKYVNKLVNKGVKALDNFF